MLIQIVLIVIGTILSIIIGIFIMIGRFHKKVPQGIALVRTGFGGAKVAYDSGIFVIPALHKLEKVDISLKKIEVELLGTKAITFKDNQQADYRAFFFIWVAKNKKAMVEVAQTIPAQKTFDLEALHDIFASQFASAIKKTARAFDSNQIYERLDEFEIRIMERIGTDLNGYQLNHLVSDHLEILDKN